LENFAGVKGATPLPWEPGAIPQESDGEEEITRLFWVGALSSLQCFNTVVWGRGKASSHKKVVPLISKSLF